MYLSGYVAVVTGGGRGIGRTTALKLAAAGATVVAVARTAAELNTLVEEIEVLGGSGLAFVADVTQSTDVQALASELDEKFNQVDILVNCAGAALIAPLSDTSESDWNHVIDTNLKGTFLCTQAMLDLLRNAGSGLIVNIASKVAITGHAMVTVYTAAKAGVLGFTRSLAQELSPENIRVVALCPGPVDTPMRWAATPDIDPRLLLPAETVAETILFLATLGPEVTTGELILQTTNYDENLVTLDE